MHLAQSRFAGLSELLRVNIDGVLSIGAVLFGLLAGAFLGEVLIRLY